MTEEIDWLTEMELATVAEVAYPHRFGMTFTAVTGVYLVRDARYIVRYVGHTQRSIPERLRHHLRSRPGFQRDWIVSSILLGDAALERELIERYLPDFNTHFSAASRRVRALRGGG